MNKNLCVFVFHPAFALLCWGFSGLSVPIKREYCFQFTHRAVDDLQQPHSAKELNASAIATPHPTSNPLTSSSNDSLKNEQFANGPNWRM